MPDRVHWVQLRFLVADRDSFPSSESLRPVSSIIANPRSPQALFHDLGRGIAAVDMRVLATVVVKSLRDPPWMRASVKGR
jgi:hypothetical protein